MMTLSRVKCQNPFLAQSCRSSWWEALMTPRNVPWTHLHSEVAQRKILMSKFLDAPLQRAFHGIVARLLRTHVRCMPMDVCLQ
jgi:hypothetical protein